jgi:hypothetical protein
VQKTITLLVAARVFGSDTGAGTDGAELGAAAAGVTKGERLAIAGGADAGAGAAAGVGSATKIAWHAGQRTFLPTVVSGTCKTFWHALQDT